MPLILLVKKPISKTSFEVLRLVEKKTQRKYFHTGTLDVMAEGLLILVSCKLRFLEKFFKNFTKTYEFEFIAGFKTDTHDLLGLVYSTNKSPTNGNFKTLPLKLLHTYTTQSPPKVSYKNLNSKAKLNRFLSGMPLKTLPKRSVKIHSLKYLGSNKISKNSLFKKIHADFKKIDKNYRQESILKSYDDCKENIPNLLFVYKYKMRVSGGFYIRAFVRDISKMAGVPLTTFSIKRTNIGMFSLRTAKSVDLI